MGLGTNIMLVWVELKLDSLSKNLDLSLIEGNVIGRGKKPLKVANGVVVL